jgi:glycosyltransferase involved in cell wall biosynthesis
VKPRASAILYVHNSADVYGASRSLLRLLGRLDRERFTPLVVLPEEGPLRGLLEQAGAEVVIYPKLAVISRHLARSPRLLLFPFRLLSSGRFLRRLIRRRGIDLVHTNSAVIPAGALAARQAGVPHLWHIREWFQEFRGLWGPYSRFMVRNSARVLAVSEAVATQFGDRQRVEVLHNGFDLAEFAVPGAEYARAFRQQWQLGDEPIVGTVGRIKLVRKGQEIFVRAAALLEQRGCRARWVIVGAPFPGNESHLAELRRLIREHNLEARVILTGELPDPRKVYPALEVFVLPSAQPEPFGGVVMEAMAMGVPVVATAIGGSVDQVAEGVTGFLVPPGDPVALADRVESLLRDPALRERMAQAGPQRIARHFALADTVARLEQIYRETIDAASGGHPKSQPVSG